MLLTSGHKALDHRIFSKEALSLARRFECVRVVGVHPRDETINGVEIRALKPYRSRPERFLVHPMRCFLAARDARRGVLILHDAELLPWVPVARLLIRARLIYDAHEDFSNLLVRRNWLPGTLKPFARWVGRLEKWLAGTCDGVIGVTQTLADSFDHPRRIAVYNFPSPEFLEATSMAANERADRDVDIVHLGTLSEERLGFLIRVIRRLDERRPRSRVLLIGLRPEQIATVETALAGMDVEAHGAVPYDRVPSMLARCSVGVNVHPILYPHLVCAVPVKVFEYLAAGCAVVTSYLPELQRLLDEEPSEQIVTVREAEADRYASEIEHLLADTDALAAARPRLMQMVAERWSWGSEEAKLVDFVGTVAAGAR